VLYPDTPFGVPHVERPMDKASSALSPPPGEGALMWNWRLPTTRPGGGGGVSEHPLKIGVSLVKCLFAHPRVASWSNCSPLEITPSR